MRKALIPMLASLALCGAATTAMVMSSARAQPGPHKPMMVAASGTELAANDAPSNGTPPRGMHRPSPQDFAARMKQMCNDHYARQSAQLAYLEASLQLTAAEEPLFQRWKTAKLGIAHRQADACAQRPLPQRANEQGAGGPDGSRQNYSNKAGTERPSLTDRMAREENRLKQRLADLQTEQPPLEAFYNALSPPQKMELARAGMRERMAGRMEGRNGPMRHHMFADARGPRGPRPMGPGAMGEGPMGPPDAPPPER